MGKKSSGDGGVSAQARADEQARQERIRTGAARINAIFDGGTVKGTQPNRTPFEDSGAGKFGNFLGANGGFGARFGEGTPDETYAGSFTDDFYKKRRDAYAGYYLPQLEDQFKDTRKELTFDLARAGTLNSSMRAAKDASLSSLFDTNKRSIQDKAVAEENNTRNAVESARGDLMTMLNTTGDAEGAASSAIHRATALSQPEAYSPLSQMFGDFTKTLGNQAASERAEALSGGAYKANFNTGLFANNGNAVKVS